MLDTDNNSRRCLLNNIAWQGAGNHCERLSELSTIIYDIYVPDQLTVKNDFLSSVTLLEHKAHTLETMLVGLLGHTDT